MSPSSSLVLRWVALTDTGLRRANNEDSGYASERMLIVADGMGGAAAGEIASAETVNEIRKLDRADLGHGERDALGELSEAVEAANQRLAQIIADDPAVEGMGTTLEALVFDGEKIAWAHIGDSRVYRLRGGQLAQLSTDHTLVQSLVEEGRISSAEARVHPHRSLILRAMLGRDDNDADLTWLQPAAGDRFLLCSDGLSDMVDPDVIERDLRSESIDIAATELIRHALEAGGYDNVTVVVGEFVRADHEVDPELSCADGHQQLVGAAAESPQSRRGKAITATPTTSDAIETERATGAAPSDPEELRYAARPPTARRLWRTILATAVVIAAVIGAGAWAYDWSQRQFFVSVDGDHVAIFRGVQLSLPGVELHHVDGTTDIEVSSLPSFQRDRVTAGIEADSRAQAEQIVEELRANAATPEPETPSAPSPRPRAQRSATPATPAAPQGSEAP